MDGNGTSYANEEQHVTTGHAPARATFLTESTRLSFPLSSSSCTIPTSDSPHSTFILLSFALPITLSLSLRLFLLSSPSPLPRFIPVSFRFVSPQPKSSNFSSLSPLSRFHIVFTGDLYLSNDFSIDLPVVPLGDKCATSRQIEKWRKRKGSNEDANDRIRWRFRGELFIEMKKATVRGIINGTTDIFVIFRRAFLSFFLLGEIYVCSNLRGKLLTFSYSCVFMCEILWEIIGFNCERGLA